MHYCNWNIADYASHTAHLSMIEDAAYRRMLDAYYLHERPLRGTAKTIARSIRADGHEAEVRSVLAQFFVRTPDGYRNKRADDEIDRYRKKIEQASNAGRASVERRLNGRSTKGDAAVQPTKNQEPRTNPTPTPPAERGGGAEPSADPAIQIQFALEPTGYRSGLKVPLQRRFELGRRAAELVTTGLTPPDVSDLWDLAKATPNVEDPGALLAHWLDENLWREVLDEKRGKAKHREAKARAKSATGADPLEGVYGT